MRRDAFLPSILRLAGALALLSAVLGGASAVGAASDIVRDVTIRAVRDMGYFAGDLVRADVEIVIADGYELEPASLPHPGPIAYWLDLRKIDVAQRRAGAATRFVLQLVYQNFYDALDARPMEIPGFKILLRRGSDATSVDVPAWNIGVSPLREVAPPVKSEPKDYMRADETVPSIDVAPWWWASAGTAAGTLLALALLARDRAWWPFHARPTRAFGQALRQLRALGAGRKGARGYRDALLVVHRAIDRTAGRRVLADDLPAFLARQPAFAAQREGLAAFFAASRRAFFASDTARAADGFSTDGIERLTRRLAAAERVRP